jgi:hypothetical protein
MVSTGSKDEPQREEQAGQANRLDLTVDSDVASQEMNERAACRETIYSLIISQLSPQRSFKNYGLG